jgi:serine/threonine protein phosphatase PrpC
MFCCFKDNTVTSIPGSPPPLSSENSGRKLGKKKSSKQIIPFEVGVATDPNLAQMSNRSSPQMEDATCVSLDHTPGHHFFAVFDGHGGKDVAQYCSGRAQHVFFGVRTEHPDWTALQVWTQTYAALDKEIQENLAIEDADCEGSTCTTFHFHVLGNGKFHISIANAGDSKAVLIDERDFRVLSETHRPTNELEEKRVKSEGGRITGERNKRLNGRLAVTRALGDHLMKKTTKGLTSTPFVQDIVTVDDSAMSVVVMASDGLWDVVPDSLVMHAVRSAATESAQAIAEKLKGLALQHRSMDNIAVVAVKIKPKPTAQ